jgi:uncharacterized glyoxalase superfamily protein PhnB
LKGEIAMTTSKVKAIPDGMRSVTPHLICAGAADAIEFYKKAFNAVEAGAKITMPLGDMFWGDRYCKLEDPFGHHWSVATHVRDVSPDEMQDAMQKMGG